MYARYIPQKKKVKAQEVEYPQPATNPASQNTNVSSGLYARYIPPPKTTAPQKRKIVFDYDESPSIPDPQSVHLDTERKSKRAKHEVNSTVEGVALSKKTTDASDQHGAQAPREDGPAKMQKEKRKEKKRNKDGDGTEQNGTLDATDTLAQPAKEAAQVEEPTLEEPNTERVEEKKKRKTKKSKVKNPNAAELAEEPVAETVSTRHKAVLEKAALSLDRARHLSKGEHEGEDDKTEGSQSGETGAVEELHGLEPLPQPDSVQDEIAKPTYETLPPWLAEPIWVSPEMRASFSELGINPDHGINAEAEKVLQAKGWTEAFAVQTAVIPLLLPSPERQGDLVISAATGSGKTLAYVLPMVRDISRGVSTKLRALIVVPTRELVQQVQDACETCSRAFSSTDAKRVRVGIAMGSQSFKKEQAALMEEEQVYEPEAYQVDLRKRHAWPFIEDSDEGVNMDLFDDSTRALPNHVIRHNSKIDILICTPGRLVEHINSTPGFTLDFVRWLVVDEADKLLGQSFQQWLDILMGKLSVEKFGSRDFEDSNQSGVRKIILSATMTTDLNLLNSLKLSRPRHVILDAPKKDAEESRTSTQYALPELLQEAAVKIREESQKPLYVVELLCGPYLIKPGERIPQTRNKPPRSMDTDEDATPDSSSADEFDDDEDDLDDNTANTSFSTTALIFTKSNENALRLSRLITLLAPHLEPLVGTLTSTTRTSERRKTIRSFASRKTRILVASDLTARGIDLPDLDHVINYDMPPSAEVYVHRVGRTARAGRPGHAWTLFTKKEAGWFWPEVAGQGKGRGEGPSIKRTNKVEKVTVGELGGHDGDVPTGRFGDERVDEYEAALKKLGDEAGEARKKKG